MMEGFYSHDTEARKRRLEELFQDEPFLSATMKASRLHEREPPITAISHAREEPRPTAGSPRPPAANPADAKVARLGFVVDIHQEAEGIRAEILPEDAPDVMTTSEAASFMRVAAATIRKWVRERGLPCARVGRARRFRKSALFRWLKSKEKEG